MRDAFAVRVLECPRDVAQHRDGLGDRELATREPRAKRLALHERHGVVRQALHLPGREQRDDVRVLQPGGERDLAVEARDRHGPRELGGEDFHDDAAAEGGFFGHEHVRHPSAAELAFDRVCGAQ
jgi:hypothetical protein